VVRSLDASTDSGGNTAAEVVFQYEMSDAFRLEQVIFVLDGAVQCNVRGLDLGGPMDLPVFAGFMAPGDHLLQIAIVTHGTGTGFYSYLKEYKSEARSSHQFRVEQGKTTGLAVIAYEKGGITTPVEERAAIRFNETVRSNIPPQSPPNTVR
jgi:hypothetical protein